MISIVIPTYNEEKYIERCLKSLVNCKYEDYEIIIVDGNSSDSTLDIVKKYTNKILIEKKREGIAPARNKGLKIAKGEIVAFLDADSIPCKGWIDIIMENFKQKYDVVYGPVYYGKWYDFYTKLRILLNFFEPILLKFFGDISLIFFYLSGNNSAYKKELLKKVGGFPAVICEDFALSKKLREIGAKMYFDRKMIVKLSSRRFKKIGFLKTLLIWCSADLNIILNNGKNSISYRAIN